MYVRQQGMSDVERVVDAVNELTIHAAAPAEAGDFSHEEARAFLELTEPMPSRTSVAALWLSAPVRERMAWCT